ncbi:MAG: hypothetical protein ACO3JL_10355 [Myxococcota bacterium]
MQRVEAFSPISPYRSRVEVHRMHLLMHVAPLLCAFVVALRHSGL